MVMTNKGSSAEAKIKTENQLKLEVGTKEEEIAKYEKEIARLEKLIPKLEGSKFTVQLKITGPSLDYDSGVQQFDASQAGEVIRGMRAVATAKVMAPGREAQLARGELHSLRHRVRKAREMIDSKNHVAQQRLRKLFG